MAQRILITPEQLENVARQFKDNADKSQDMINWLSQQVEGMNGQWDGMTKHQFFEKFQDAQKSMNNYVGLLQQIDAELRNIAQRFRQADSVK